MGTDVVTLRRFRIEDVAAHNAGEDTETIRWLTEGRASTVESTETWIRRGLEMHDASEAHDGPARGELAWAVELDGRLAGMVAVNAEPQDGIRPGDVNVSYGVHPWARGRGVAVAAVRAAAEEVRRRGLGSTVVFRIEPGNLASLRVAEACGAVDAGRIRSGGVELRVRRWPLPAGR